MPIEDGVVTPFEGSRCASANFVSVLGVSHNWSWSISLKTQMLPFEFTTTKPGLVDSGMACPP